MKAVHPVDEVRRAEADLMAELPSGALMQRAAAALASTCAGRLGGCYGRRVVLLVGKGDNGGDAMYAGVRLARRGARVDALLTADSAHEAAGAALRRAGGLLHQAGAAGPTDLLAGADLVVDGVLGIGGRGGLRGVAATCAGIAGKGAAPVVAADVPSGVDAATGAVAGVAVRADVTVTFGTLKPGLVVSPGAEYAGRVECADIGLGPRLPRPRLTVPEPPDVARLLPRPAWEATKYTRGVLGVVAGSDAYTGAAVLAVAGGLRAGVGMVRYVGVARPAAEVRAAHPEAVVTLLPAGPHGGLADPEAVLEVGRVQAWVVGPGMGTDPDAAAVLARLLRTELPVLLDADALTLVAGCPDQLRERSAATLVTPHVGEFGRLTGVSLGEVEQDRLGAARRAAAELGVTVLLKGSTTVIADPDGTARVNPTGTPWLATAGSGDVLSGAAGALLAAGLSALDAGTVAAYLHGLAARLAGGSPAHPIRAGDVARRWPEAVRAVRGVKTRRSDPIQPGGG